MPIHHDFARPDWRRRDGADCSGGSSSLVWDSHQARRPSCCGSDLIARMFRLSFNKSINHDPVLENCWLIYYEKYRKHYFTAEIVSELMSRFEAAFAMLSMWHFKIGHPRPPSRSAALGAEGSWYISAAKKTQNHFPRHPTPHATRLIRHAVMRHCTYVVCNAISTCNET